MPRTFNHAQGPLGEKLVPGLLSIAVVPRVLLSWLDKRHKPAGH